MIYIIMGVSGCGKTSLGTFLSERVNTWTAHYPNTTLSDGVMFIRKDIHTDLVLHGSPQLGWPFYEGDNFHPQDNIEKMARGEPLTDQDRLPWLLRLHEVIESERSSGSDALLACSALKRLYRQILLHGATAVAPTSSASLPSSPEVFFLYLHGDYDLIHQRMVARQGHYMKADLLRSQFDILEPPSDEENALTLDIRKSWNEMILEVEKHIEGLKL